MTDVSFDPRALDLPSAHFIGGQRHTGRGDRIIVNAASDGKAIADLPEADAALVDEAVTNAAAVWSKSGWGVMPPRERARIMRRWADLIEADVDHLAQLEAAVSTRPVTLARNDDVPVSADVIRFFAELADKMGGDVAATRSASLGLMIHEPYGVVGAITPWNFPISMACWKCGPALAAGNAIVIKPSELTPYSTVRLAELAVQAGIPAGIVNVVHGRGASTGAALVRHPLIAKMSFTGSTRTGAAIMADIATSGIKPVTLELGGKSPQLVFAELQDLQATAQAIVRGFTSNGGQACVAGTRLIAHPAIVEPLLEAIIANLPNETPHPTWSGEARYAPIINEAQAERIDRLVDASVGEGAEVLAGGSRFSDGPGGAYYRPTVVTRVHDAMPIVREELFGPVLSVQTFESEEEGIALAGHPTYGLAAGIHTRDIGQAMRAMRGIAAGTVWINRYGRSRDMIIPTGGYGQSGIGKDLGKQAMEANMRLKSVLVDF